MGTDRPFEQARNFGRAPSTDDRRKPWTGAAPTIRANVPAPARQIIKQYLAVHGDWETQSVTNQNVQRWLFTRCECPICVDAQALVGDPETPNG